jgi:hypothetical protein
MAVSVASGWETYALVGRPDFLNYLRRGDVTWEDLWAFYSESAVEPSAVVRLSGLFHLFLSQEFEREGSVLEPESDVYRRLKLWATFAVDRPDRAPESGLRDSLADLLGQSLISPLYYEAVFSVYLEATLELQAKLWPDVPSDSAALPHPEIEDRKLALRLSGLPRCPEVHTSARWDETLSILVDRHYATWNYAYALALGDEDEDWIDEGGGG